jgi:phospholipid transport system substrate-binding protein
MRYAECKLVRQIVVTTIALVAVVSALDAMTQPYPDTERASLAADAAATDAARMVVTSLHHALIVSAARDADKNVRYLEILPVVAATHDLAYIAELTIRRQWRTLDDASKQEFVAAFERLSVMTYVTRFGSVGPDTFRIDSSEFVDNGRVEVKAAIVRQSDPDVSLDYVLQAKDGEWRIVNILAGGVSDLALKRAQYQRVFRDGGSMDALIDEIELETRAL